MQIDTKEEDNHAYSLNKATLYLKKKISGNTKHPKTWCII